MDEVAHKGAMKNIGSNFYAKRAGLFKKLDIGLNQLALKSIKLPTYDKVKSRLNLSTKSVIHNADEIISKGAVPNLGRRIGQVANLSKGASAVGFIGVGIDAAASIATTYEACTVENGECSKTGTTQLFRVVGSGLGGYYGGMAGGAVGTTVETGAASIAVVFGVTVGAPVIAVVGVTCAVAGAVYGGSALADEMEIVGETIYEYFE